MIQQFRITQSRRARDFGLLEIYIRCNNSLSWGCCGTHVSVDGVCWQIKVHTIAIGWFFPKQNERNEMTNGSWGRGMGQALQYRPKIFVLTNVLTWRRQPPSPADSGPEKHYHGNQDLTQKWCGERLRNYKALQDFCYSQSLTAQKLSISTKKVLF